MPDFPKNTSPAMYKSAPFKQKNRKKLFDFKGYIRGEQGSIPDIGGESTKSTVKGIKEKIKKTGRKIELALSSGGYSNTYKASHEGMFPDAKINQPRFSAEKKELLKKSSSFKMKGSPMQRNFGISPVKNDKQWMKDMKAMEESGEMNTLKKEVKADTKWRNERNRRLDILDKDYPEIVSQKGSPGPGYKKIKGTNIYTHPLGMKEGRDKRDPNLRYTFFGDTKENRFEY